MKQLFVTILCAMAALGIQAAAPQDFKLELINFSELKVSDAVRVEYHIWEDTVGMAKFSCSPAMASNLIFNCNKNAVNVQLDIVDAIDEQVPTVHIYSSGLTKVENSSDSVVTINDKVAQEAFKARVIGNGKIVIKNIEVKKADLSISTGCGRIVVSEGVAEELKISNVGTGAVEAGTLQAKKVKAKVLGTGNIDCYASESLTVSGAGSGKVYYLGNPKKQSNRGLGIEAISVGGTK